MHSVQSRFRGIQAGFDLFKQKDISPQRTVKDFTGIVVNRSLLFLHDGSLEITLTVHLIKKVLGYIFEMAKILRRNHLNPCFS